MNGTPCTHTSRARKAAQSIHFRPDVGTGRPAHVNLAVALVGKGNWKKRVPPSLVSRCYGSGAPGRKFFEDIAATPASPSPSKGVGGEAGTQSLSSAGSANQNTTWFRSVRTPVMLLKAKASSMMASTRTDPVPCALVVKSPIY